MSKEIRLTRGKVAIVDDEDFERLNQLRWHTQPHGRTFYAIGNQKGKTVRLHHLLLPKPVDHINGDGLDNRRCNLRTATHQQNCRNKRGSIGKTSKYKGVCWYHNKCWHAQIRTNKKTIHLGYFNSEIEAAKAYNEAAMKLFGKFARLNDLAEPEPAKDSKQK